MEGADDATACAPEVKIKKSKSFERIRDIPRGVSRRERPAHPAKRNAAATDGANRAHAEDEFDETSIVTPGGAYVDDRSGATGGARTAAANFLNKESLLDEKKADDSMKALFFKSRPVVDAP